MMTTELHEACRKAGLAAVVQMRDYLRNTMKPDPAVQAVRQVLADVLDSWTQNPMPVPDGAPDRGLVALACRYPDLPGRLFWWMEQLRHAGDVSDPGQETQASVWLYAALAREVDAAILESWLTASR